MTDFSAGDPGSGAPTGQTNFQAGGVAAPAASGQEDTTVLLEYQGRQYTKTELLKKLTHADNHVTRLESERAEDRRLLQEVNETLKKQVTAAELLKQMRDGQPPVTPPATTTAPPAVDAATIAAQVLGTIKEGEAAAQREANWKAVTTTLTQVFGEKVNEQVAKVAAETGMSVAEAAEMARSKPQAFLRLFPEVQTKPKPSAIPNQGQHNTQSFQATKRGASGFITAKSVREQVDIYQARLRELGL